MPRFLILFACLSLALVASQRAFGDDDAADDAQDAQDVQSHLTKAQQLESEKNYAAAAEEYKAALDIDPDLDQAIRDMGNCYYRLGDREKSFSAYSDYLEYHPEDEKVRSLAISAARPAASNSMRVLVQAGYGWALKHDAYGHRFNAQSNVNGFPYGFGAGEGVAPTLEFTYAAKSGVEGGIGVFPMFLNTSAAATHIAGVTTTSDSTSVSMAVIPVLAELGMRAYLTPRLSLFTTMGVGAAFSTSYNESFSDTTSDTNGTTNTQGQYSRSLETGVAYRGAMGANYRVSKHLSLFIDAALLVSNLTARSVTYSDTVYDSSGNQIGYHKATVSYTGDAPAGFPAVIKKTYNPSPLSPDRTETTTFDNGGTLYTQVLTYTGGKLSYTAFDESNTFLVGHGADDISFNQLSLSLGLNLEF